MSLGLVAAGHNVTVVSPGKDVSSKNLHFIHMEKVYDRVYNALDEAGVNFFDIGLTNPFLQFLYLPDWPINTCLGLVESDGWDTLSKYPNDFKVSLMK